MAQINFPASPTVGQQYSANGITWEWSGESWVAYTSTDSDSRLVDHTTVSVIAGTGISGGGTIDSDLTLNITNTGVTAQSYGSASQIPVFTVNAQGQITTASTASVAGVTDLDFDSANAKITITTADASTFETVVSLDPFTTADLTENTNLYYTEGRVSANTDVAANTSKLAGIEPGATADQTAGEIEAIVSHDNLQNIPANDHIDWTVDNAGTDINIDNITNNAITNAKLAQVGTTTIKGRATAGTGNVEDLTPTQVRSIINVENNATADQTAGEIEAIVSHDNLLGVDSAQHIDWTVNTDASIDPGNYVQYTHPNDGVDPGAALTGKTVFSDITVNALGHVTGTATRQINLIDLGFTGDSNATNFVHPTHPGDDIDVDTTPLTGATIVSDIDINVTTDSFGHVTDANGAVATRTLTLADLGYTGSPTANDYTHPSDGVDPGAALTGANVFSDITVNTAGHVTGTATRALTLANLGYTGTTDANTYVHPTHPGDDAAVDTGPLTGAVVISDLDFNITTDTLGHVTDANATVATRSITAANVGALAVDGTAANSTLLGGLSGSTAATVNTVAVRQANGYLFATYYNSTGTFATAGAASGMVNFTGTNGSDTYGRSYSATGAALALGMPKWDSIKSANFTAAINKIYAVNGARTITLPTAPAAGSSITVYDYSGTWGSGNAIATSSSDINNSSANMNLDLSWASVTFIYTDATVGWRTT